ncbi:ubiquitin-associated- domain-containing protein [Alkaliphilus metalliredigens QYMF]|uniref:Ubiquitin-associated-domain-containing protein n=1 Tax=Alkaliphilus metalliredigens (strain QYMF) TaxID=293826 RepID=A6TSJ5_ALKMQ|nr:DUF4342 domain-containing protein [Alkaliphilus metalliredigens]ABR49163.1 ubiquitin-associated- domain-containing protein [Alkaliphilus metalliredigens QYMF]
MDINLEKIDIIRERTGVSYKEAKEALVSADGDIVEALIQLEEKNAKSWTDNLSKSVGNTGNEMMEKIKYMIKKGNVTKIIVKRDGDVLLNVPVTAGAVGVMLAPLLAVVGASAALLTKTTIEIVKDNGEVVDINEIADDTMTEFKNRFSGSEVDDMVDDIIDDIDETLDDLNDGADY